MVRDFGVSFRKKFKSASYLDQFSPERREFASTEMEGRRRHLAQAQDVYNDLKVNVKIALTALGFDYLE